MKNFGKSVYKLRLKNGRAVTLRHHQRPYTKQDAGLTGNAYKAVSAAYLNYVRTAFGFIWGSRCGEPGSTSECSRTSNKS